MRRSLPAVAAIAAGALALSLGSSALAAPVAPNPSPVTPAAAALQAMAGPLSTHRAGAGQALAGGPTARAAVGDPVALPRIAGADRYATSAAAYNLIPADVPMNVVLASGENFPDALTAGSAGVASGFVVLLTKAGSLPAPVSDALKAHPPVNLVIAGGQVSVSSAVESQVRATVPSTKVVRIAGTNRYDTAVQVAYALQINPAPKTYGSQAWVVSGENFPDALSAGAASKWANAPARATDGTYGAPPAAWGRAPLLLARRDSLPAETRAALTDPGAAYTTVTIVGGATSISPAVEQQIRQAVPAATVKRIEGVNRYDTARQVALNTWGDHALDGVYFTSGENFPDALVASSYVTPASPILLTRRTCVPAPTVLAAFDELSFSADAFALIFGGAAGTSDPGLAPECP